MRKVPKWQIVKPNLEAIKYLNRSLNISPLLAHILVARGIKDPELAYHHLNPSLRHFADPFLLPAMDLAVERLLRALYQKEKLALYGDYDVDGVTGTAILYLFLKEIGLEPEIVFPHRERDGYGFHSHLLPPLKEKGVSLLITVDCGITGHEACEEAQRLGIDVIITDHHQVPLRLPEALAVINPQVPSNRYPYKDLAGVGVAFCLIRALRQALYQKGFFSSRPIPNLKRYLDLVALGTIADIVPLVGENRLIAWFGLQELSQSKRPGICALKRVAGLEEQSVGVTEVIYRLAPRINAAGRLREAQLAFRLLTTTDHTQAQSLAEELNRLNGERQRIEEHIFKEAWQEAQQLLSKEKERFSLVLSGKNWPLGVIGIVASKLQEAFYLPVILLSEEDHLLRGSGRSIPEVNLYACLKHCAPHLLRFGGHPAAAGVKLRPEQKEDFCKAFEEAVRQSLKGEMVSPTLKIDAWVNVNQLLEPQFLEGFIRLGPFGPGFPEPLFALKGFEVRQPRLIKEKHLKFYLWQQGLGLEAIAFGLGAQPQDIKALAASLDFTEFQGRRYVQLLIHDLK